MSDTTPGAIEQFVAFVRRRVNQHRLWTALIGAALVGAGLFVGVSLAYVLPGYAVPRAWAVAALAIAASYAAIAWAWSRLSVDQSARFADRFYNLQDAVASYLHFSRAGRRDGYYALQAAHTRRQVDGLSPEAIRYQPPRRTLAVACGLVAVAIPLGLRGPSAEVLEKLRLEEAVEAATMQANEQLEELVEELNAEVKDPFERELVDPEELRKWVDELAATKDHKEALRQYAQLERKLNAARLATQRKRDEQLLARAAEKLAETRETRPLAEKLAQQDYKQAAEELDELTPDGDKPASESRKALARLKAAAQRMAAAARASRASAGSPSSSASQSQSQAKASKNGGGSSSASAEGASGSAGGGELAQDLEDLEAAVADLDEALEDAERQEAEFGECDAETAGECQNCQAAVAQKLGKLSKSLKKLAIRRDAEKKLASLCKACSECQGECAGLCLSPLAKPGGKKAGWASSDARRDARDELVDNGQTTQLRGTKGAGPSLATVEQADEGSGVSHRQATSRQRQFQRQFEAFVQREDVPEQVKRGVKNYFQLIHQMDSTPAGGAESEVE